ncbi:MAG: transporter substrate-binding protein [Candidatus Nitrosotenuis sp.]|nr:transporter substrate-binding protein [Candidatus Nitrosotenuis sp.]
MSAKRIVSFLPSATELLYELGSEENLVGVTHECLYPEQAKTKLRIINSVFDPEKMNSKQIDDKVAELVKNGKDIFVIDEENLKKADPDLIIAQGTCAVCSAYTNEVNKALEILQQRPHVIVLDPHTIDDILNTVTIIAKKIGKENEGEKLVKSLKKRIDFIKSKSSKKPSVLCIEWIEPFFTSGHWVPQMIEIAGGLNCVSTIGEHSRRMTIDEIEKADPDIIVMMPCGFDTNRTTSECTMTLQNNPRWNNLRAVRNSQVFAVDANAYFSKPSIRTITGIEILAKIINPNESTGMKTPENSFKQI